MDSFVSSDSHHSYKYCSVSLVFFFFSDSHAHYSLIYTCERCAKSIVHERVGEGRKFRNNLHLQTGLIISPLKLVFLILSFTNLDFTIHICGPPGRQGGRLSLYNFFIFFIIFFFFKYIHSSSLSSRFILCLSLIIVYCSSSFAQLLHTLSLFFPFSQLGSVCAERLLPVAPNLVRNCNSHRFLLSRDFFFFFLFFHLFPRAILSHSLRLLSSSIRFYFFLRGSIHPNKKDHLLRSRDFVASTTVASRTLGSLHASIPSIVSSVFHLFPLNRHPFHPSSPTHPLIAVLVIDSPRGTLFSIFFNEII